MYLFIYLPIYILCTYLYLIRLSIYILSTYIYNLSMYLSI